ncbi:MAG TPA: hypothetical protein VMH83_06780 [Candidatus Acidoferrum sp.]|nr:hypothetical protein [Candidatus Acidoferrum sp.]
MEKILSVLTDLTLMLSATSADEMPDSNLPVAVYGGLDGCNWVDA